MSQPNAVNLQRETLLKEAANWLTRLDEGDLSTVEQKALDCWYQTSPEHIRVWQAACELNNNFSQVPGALARPVLGRKRLSRRTMVKAVFGVGFLLPLSWSLSQQKPWQPMVAEYRSEIGEQLTFSLADGSELILNTNTALDVKFDSRRRTIHLYQGEMFVRTGKDAQRSLVITTSQGDVQALGTEFSVRSLADVAQVVVLKDSVRIAPKYSLSTQELDAGQQCIFKDNAIVAIEDNQPNSLAWRKGELIVNNWRLQRFVDELSRYRSGVLRCDDDIADLRVSGVFRTNKTEQALDVLQELHGLTINRFTDYWISISKAV